ncbi:MAG: putative nucleic acid-binding Zn-ribbon protein [bacterium]
MNEKDYINQLQTLKLGKNKRLIRWIQQQLEKIRSRNSQVSGSIREKYQQWETRKKEITAEVRTLEIKVAEMKKQVKGKYSNTIEGATQQWKQLSKEYSEHLENRLILQRQQESRRLDTTNTKNGHWASLGKETLNTLQN